MKKTGSLVLCLTIPFAAQALDVKPIGDLRTGYYSKESSETGKANKAASEIRFRIRAGVKTQISHKLSASLRFAGRFYAFTDPYRRNDTGFDYIDAIPQYKDSIPAGQTSIDNAFLKYTFGDKSYVRVGRFRSSYELKGVAKKSLDRNNSPNSDITWTDGAHLSMKLPGHHRLNAIAQYNPENATTVLRKPLNFARTKSRLSYFLGLQHTKTKGPFVQREIDLTIMPAALCESGINAAANGCNDGLASTYVAGVVRLASQWKISDSGTKFLLGTEFGYSPTTADKNKVNGGDDGVAYQLTFNFIGFAPKHSIGAVYNKAGGAWLLSPDFTNNNTLKELRYAWKFAKKQKIEFRIRQRENIVASDKLRNDLYLRYTVKI